MPSYINIQALTGVTSAEVNTGTDTVGPYTLNGTTIARAPDNNRAAQGLSLTLGSYRMVRFTLPVGYTYTGNVRTTVATFSGGGSPYTHYAGGWDDSSDPAPGTVVVDSLLLAAGVDIYIGIGINDGSPSTNSGTITIEVEADLPPPGDFWTDLVGCVEITE